MAVDRSKAIKKDVKPMTPEQVKKAKKIDYAMSSGKKIKKK